MSDERAQQLPDGHLLPGVESAPGTVKRGRYGPGGGYYWMAVYADGAESPLIFRAKDDAENELRTQRARKYAVKEAYATLAKYTACAPNELLADNTRLQAKNEALEGAHHDEREKRIANGLLVTRLRCALNDAYFWMTHEPETDAERDVLAKVLRRTHTLVNPHIDAALPPDTTPTEEGR